MLATIRNILPIIGIVLLIVLAVAVVLVLLVLFLPIVYRVNGSKQEKDIQVCVKARWLFGLLNVRYAYPEPNAVIVRLFGFELFHSGKQGTGEEAKQPTDESSQDKLSQEVAHSKTPDAPTKESTLSQDAPTKDSASSQDASTEEDALSQEDTTQAHQTFVRRIKSKIQKIKYTILGIYDKIKHIVNNIAYYKGILQEEETKQLFRHVSMRMRKIWKNIHPRKLQANLHVGTGSPDTTGYLCAVYGMLCTYFGNSVTMEPDFEQAVCEGDFYIAGHITIFQLLRHGVAIILDKNLHLFWNKLKQGGMNQNGR